MLTINITEEFNTADNLADTLRKIADMVEEGYTSGYYPTWSLSGEEEQEQEEEQEMMDGLWLYDSEEKELYIIPTADVVREIDGPDGDIMDELNRLCRENNGVVTEEQYTELGLEKVENQFKRFNSESGYYFA